MRPHIDFVQAQHLPWEDAAPLGFPGSQIKVLSRDDASCAISTVLRLRPGAARAATALAFDEEFYVLDGAFTAAGETYSENAYGFLPSGFTDNAIASADGATLLYFRSDLRSEGPERDPDKAGKRLVRKIDLSQGQWDGDFDKFGLASFKADARMRVLRDDPETGENTYVTATIAFRRGERSERHPIVQEFFMLSGELAGEFGVMQAGAYCWRPPMEKHAPYCSPTGALILFRSHGGKQETYWEDPAFTLSFSMDHKPILPDELKPYGALVPRPSRY
jgi:hypothetical protein